jgi:hypothetical protein
MKAFLIALVALVPTALNAASPEQDYYAARDRAIKHMDVADKPGGYDDKLREYEDKVLADLTERMRRIVGPSKLQGVPGEAKSNVDTLYRGDQGFGRLDGLAYGAIDAKTRIVVSTDTLFKAWLGSRRKWWPTDEVPQDMTKALRSDVFFTQALLGDAAFQKYVDLPVKKPANASMVFAMLNTRAQDIGPYPPSEITVSVVQAHRVYVVTTPPVAEIALMQECMGYGMPRAKGWRRSPANRPPASRSETWRRRSAPMAMPSFTAALPSVRRVWRLSPRWCGRRRTSSRACR